MQSLDSDDNPTLESLFSLKGKVALVIGGAGLLGKEITTAFAELGANLIIASRDLEKNQVFASILRNKFSEIEVSALQVDITDEKSVERLIEFINLQFPEGLDILVNSGWSGKKNTFDSISMDDWNNDLDVCLTGVFRVIKRATPLLIKKRGNILNIASMYGHVAPDYRLYDSEKYANPPSYGAAKAGIIQLTKYLASFLSPHGIRVNCISPGPFPFLETQIENPHFMQRLAEKNPLNRLGLPFEIKGAASLLCTSAGSFMTGQNICVDGGWSVW
jgi:NAD(P)-dependent dehydrogenase (short-subunit alcohol dehydrogenase family)